MSDDVIGDLLDVIGHDAATYPDYCGGRWRYQVWEGRVAAPRLRALGYEVVRVYTGDGDSCGPLTRVFVVEKDGRQRELIYG